MSVIYDRIEHLLKLHNIKKSKFAADTKISTGNLGDWKRGKALPGAQALITIADYFQVSLDWLLTGKGNPYTVVENSPREVNDLVKRVLDMDEKEKDELRLVLDFLKYRKNRQAALEEEEKRGAV